MKIKTKISGPKSRILMTKSMPKTGTVKKKTMRKMMIRVVSMSTRIY